MVGKVSEFTQGANETLGVINELESEGYVELAKDLKFALARMMNGYHDRLRRMSNRIDTEMSVLEHAKQHMRRVVFPGDLRAEGREPENE